MRRVDEAFDRWVTERNRITAHLEDLARTRDALDRLIDLNRAPRARSAAPSRS